MLIALTVTFLLLVNCYFFIANQLLLFGCQLLSACIRCQLLVAFCCWLLDFFVFLVVHSHESQTDTAKLWLAVRLPSLPVLKEISFAHAVAVISFLRCITTYASCTKQLVLLFSNGLYLFSNS